MRFPVKHIHILGIGGTFMAGVALLAREAGFRVTGCDQQLYPPMSTQLDALGIDWIEGYSEEQLSLKPDLFVIGNVVSRGNPLLEAILDQGLPYQSGPEWLSREILQRCRVIAVAGTHGKTTTSSLVAWILESAGLSPGFLIGGIPQNFGVSARLPVHWSVQPLTDRQQRPWFVIEADEYDTAFFDKRSKFVHYPAEVAILNNLEFDHADIFPDLDAIVTQFHHWVRMLPRCGTLIVNADQCALKQVLEKGCWTPQVTFGQQGQWSVDPQEPVGQLTITESGQVRAVARQWALLGLHNRMNALAAVLAARVSGVKLDQGMMALEGFIGVRRRLENKGNVEGVLLLDDFAHHPTAIATTLAGLRQQMGSQGRILALLEPRSNTMKMGVWSAQLAPSLQLADRIFGYGPRLGWDLSSALRGLGERAVVFDQLTELVNAVVTESRSGDVIVTLSNGSFDGVHEALLEALRRKCGSSSSCGL